MPTQPIDSFSGENCSEKFPTNPHTNPQSNAALKHGQHNICAVRIMYILHCGCARLSPPPGERLPFQTWSDIQFHYVSLERSRRSVRCVINNRNRPKRNRLRLLAGGLLQRMPYAGCGRSLASHSLSVALVVVPQLDI